MLAPLAFIVIPVRQLTDKLLRESRLRPNWQAQKDDENVYCKVGTVRPSTDGRPTIYQQLAGIFLGEI